MKSRYPLIVQVEAKAEINGESFSGKGKIEEKDNVIEIKSEVRRGDDKKCELHIKLLNKSSDSKYHREIESFVGTPSSKTTFDGFFLVDNQQFYLKAKEGSRNMLEIKLNENGSSSLELQLGDNVDISMKATEVDKKKTLDANLKVGSIHSLVLLTCDHGEKKRLKLQVTPYAEDPHNKIVLNVGFETKSGDPVDTFVFSFALKAHDYLEVHIVERGEASLLGNYELTAKVSHKTLGQSEIKFKVEKDDNGHVKVIGVLHKGGIKRVQFELVGQRNERDSHIKASILASNIEISMHLDQKENPYESSKTIQTGFHCKKGNKVFKIGCDTTIQDTGLKFKSEMTHEKYGKNSVHASLQVSPNEIVSSVGFDGERNKKLSIHTEIKTDYNSLRIVSNMDSSFSKSGQMKVTINNEQENKSIEVFISEDEKPRFELKGNLKFPLETESKAIDTENYKQSTHASLSTIFHMKNGEKYSCDSKYIDKNDGTSIYVKVHKPNAKAQLSLKKEKLKMKGSINYDVNGKSVLKLESGFDATKRIELYARLETDRTPKILANLTYEKTEGSVSVSADVVKGTSHLLSASLNRLSDHSGEKLLVRANSHEENLLYVEISDESSAKYSNENSLKINVQVDKYSVLSLIKQNDRNSISHDIQICQKSKGICHTLKTHYENSKDKQSSLRKSHVYCNPKLTMVLEESGQGSSPKKIGSLLVDLLVSNKDIELTSTLENRGEKYGLKGKGHLKDHMDNRCSLVIEVISPKRTSTLTASIEHKSNGIKIVANANPNTNDSSNKRGFGLEMVKEADSDNKMASGSLEISYPYSTEPTSVKYTLKEIEDNFVEAVCQLRHEGRHYEFQVAPKIEKGIRSLNISIVNDKFWRGSVKLSRHDYSNAKEFICQYVYINGEEERKGGLKVTSFQKRGIRGGNIKISSTSADYEVEGSIQSTNDINFSFASDGKKQREFNMRPYGRCMLYELDKEGKPEISGEICGPNWRETPNGIEWQVMKLLIKHQENKVAHVELNLNDDEPAHVHFDLICSYKEKEYRRLMKSLHLDQFRKKVQGLVQKVKGSFDDVVEKCSRQLRRCHRQLKSKYEQHEQVIKHYIRKLQEVLRRIEPKIPHIVKDLCSKYYQHLQRVCEHLSWSKLCQSYSKYWENMKSVVRQFSYGNIKTHIRRILKRSFKFSTPTLEQLESVLPDFIVNIAKNVFKWVMPYLEQFISKWESYLREKTIEIFDWVVKKIHGMISSDRDLQTAQELIVNAKNEIVKTWRNKEQIAEASVRDLQQSVEENSRKVFNKFVEVLKNDSEAREYGFRVHPHISQSGLESLKQKVLGLFRTLQELLSR